MKKRLAYFGLALVFGLSSLFAGAFASLFGTGGALRANAVTDHNVVADYAVKKLPKRNTLVGGDVGIPEVSGGFWQLYSVLGNSDVLWADSRSDITVTGTYPTWTWEFNTAAITAGRHEYQYAGSYEYRFFDAALIDPIDQSKAFYKYAVQVEQTEYTMELGENNENIIPNVTVPNLPITFPMPEKLIDKQGRDLFDIKNSDQWTQYGHTLTGTTDEQKLEQFKQKIWEDDTVVSFYGPNGIIAHDTGAPKTFTPIIAADNYYAEYKFTNTAKDVTATYRTDNIVVENLGSPYDHNMIRGLKADGVTPETQTNRETYQIKYDAPSVSFSPAASTFKIHEEVALPRPTISLSSETDKDSESYNRARFSNTTTITSYTEIEVWYWSTEGGEPEIEYGVTGTKGPAITDFTFVPTRLGRYGFNYFTTTIFGSGYRHGIMRTGTGVYENFIDYWPFDTVTITADTVAPEIKWTIPFDYISDTIIYNPEAPVISQISTRTHYEGIRSDLTYNNGDVVAAVNFGEVGEGDILQRLGDKDFFNNAPDLSNYLPGNTTSSRTQVSNTGELVIPALVGHDNIQTANNLRYIVYLKRYENGVAKDTITFDSDVAESAQTATSKSYDNSKTFAIDFSDASYQPGGMLEAFAESGNPKGSGKNGKYDITVYARDRGTYEGELASDGYVGIPSIQWFYTFNVVSGSDADPDPITAGNFAMHKNAPKFQGSFTLRQNTYYEDDTISFRTVVPTDVYTDDSQIEVKYYYYLEGTGMTPVELTDITSGYVNFELSKDNDEAQEIFDQFDAPGNPGYVDISIIAVARNYYAMSKTLANAPFGTDTFDLIDYLAGTLTDADMVGYAVQSQTVKMYDLEYAEPAIISNASTSAAWTSTEWGTWFVNDTEVIKDKRVYLPAFSFNYDIASGEKGYVTTISFEVIKPISKGSTGVLNGGTQTMLVDNAGVTIGDVAGKELYFIPSEIGVHQVICRVTNAGGNVTVFVGEVKVWGLPSVYLELVGGTGTARVGQIAPLPTASISLDGYKFVTNEFMQIIADFDKQVDGTTDISDKVVGSYTMIASSEKGSFIDYDKNNFKPSTADTYYFEFDITIDDTLLNTNIGITANEEINRQIVHEIVVGEVQDGDIELKLDKSRYEELAAATSFMDYTSGTGVPHSDTDPDFAEFIGSNMLLTQMTSVNDFAMGLTQLERAMRIEGTKDDTYILEYGRVYLPDFSSRWTNGLNAPADFNAKSVTSVTVTSPKGDKILDTTQKDGENKYITVDGVKYYYFCPIGSVSIKQQNYDDILTTWDTEDEVVGAIHNDTTCNPVDRDIRVDGTYTITYTLTYQDATATLKFNVAVGDVATPIISFTEEKTEDLFTTYHDENGVKGTGKNNRDWRVGDTFYIDSRYFDVDANGGVRTDFNEEYIAKKLNLTVMTPNNIWMTDGGTSDNSIIKTPSRDEDIKGTQNFRIWSFKLSEPGEYTVTFNIQSESGRSATPFTRKITVTEKPEDSKISPTQVWGTVLIVLSVGLLLGVVIYFIQTGKNTKFNAAAKGKTKGAGKPDKPEKPDAVV